ncbi:MAG TPA: XF1762 family protein [Gemmatimonadales bacterium]|nr:XF1762 family protein [Gemmatimonadales bacterium]
MTLRVVPFTLAQANEAVEFLHRHHKPAVGHRFSLGVIDETGNIHGACIVGRPVARMTEQYHVAEVTRLVTDGTKNACSILYSAAARACEAMGFTKIQTFILESESGTSLRASGWMMEGRSAGGDWNCPTRGGRRVDQPQEAKMKWSKTFRGNS